MKDHHFFSKASPRSEFPFWVSKVIEALMACHGRLHDTAVPAPWKLSYAPCQQGVLPLSFLSPPPPLSLFFSIPSHPSPSPSPSPFPLPLSLSSSLLPASPTSSHLLFHSPPGKWSSQERQKLAHTGLCFELQLLRHSKWRWWAFGGGELLKGCLFFSTAPQPPHLLPPPSPLLPPAPLPPA